MMLKTNDKNLNQKSLFELKDKLIPESFDDSLSLYTINNSIFHPEIDEKKFANSNENISNLIKENKSFTFDNDINVLLKQVKERYTSSSKICIDFNPSKKQKEIKFYYIDDEFEFQKDKVITTFFLQKKPYTQFTNPEEINSHFPDKIKNIFRNKKGFFMNDFSVENDNDEENNFPNFINELNERFINYDDDSLIDSNYTTKNSLLIILFFIILLIMALIIFLMITKSMTIYYIIGAIVLFLLIIFLCFICNLIKNTKFLELKEKLFSREKYYKNLQEFLFKWNKIYFNPKNLNVECPITLDYITINLNYEEYEIWIQPHNF